MDRISNNFLLRAVLLSVVITSCFSQWVVDEDTCQTPDGETAYCVPVHTCQPMINFLSQASRPLSSKVTEKLREYQCGSAVTSVKVCCPSGTISLGGSSSTGGSGNQPPDVSNHRNLYLLPSKCGISNTEDKITYGNSTDLFEFPWMALLSYRTKRGPDFRCGGTIINNRYILTAAHCLTNLKNPLIGVRIGEHDISTRRDCQQMYKKRICAPPHQDFAIEDIIPHPSFSSTQYVNDIGLLRLARPMNLSVENAKPVCLPLDSHRLEDPTGENVIVTGWGATETGRPSQKLLKVSLRAISNADCSRRYEGMVTINDKQMCAQGQDGSDSCSGDSGGPLHLVNQDTEVLHIQHGVVSFGPRFCGQANNPGVYTRVAHYMDWILDNIRP